MFVIVTQTFARSIRCVVAKYSISAYLRVYDFANAVVRGAPRASAASWPDLGLFWAPDRSDPNLQKPADAHPASLTDDPDGSLLDNQNLI
jgi:hypothetical protein